MNCDFVRIDMEGLPITFKFNNKGKIKSLPGAVFSMVFYLFSVYYFVSEFYYYTANPSVKELQIETVDKPRIDFRDFPDFMVMMCKVDSANNSISYLPEIEAVIEETLILNMVSRIPFYYRTYEAVKLERCTEDMFPSEVSNSRSFNSYYKDCTCASSQSLKNFNVSFFFSDSYYTYMEYTAQFKQEVLNDKTKLQKAYDLLASNPPRHEFFFIDTSAQINNQLEPFKMFFNSHLNYYNPDTLSFSDIWFNRIILQIDDDYFVNRTVTKMGMSKDNSANYFQSKPLDKRKDGFLIKIRLRTSNKIITITRRNIKLDYFLGQKLSFLAAFYIIIVLFIRFNNSFETDKKIVRHLFHKHSIADDMKDIKEKIYRERNEVFDGKNGPEDNHIIDIDLDFEPQKDYNPFYGVNQPNGKKASKSQKDYKQKPSSVSVAFSKHKTCNSKIELENVEEEVLEPKSPIDKDVKNQPISKEMPKNVEVIDNTSKQAQTEAGDLNIETNKKEETAGVEEVEQNRYSFPFNFLTLCCRKKNNKIKDDFENACQFVNYYMDIQTYLRKMLEIEVIKFCFFSKNERDCISFLANPDASIDKASKIRHKLKQDYDMNPSENAENLAKDKLETVMRSLVQDAKERKVSKRLLRLITDNTLKFKF